MADQHPIEGVMSTTMQKIKEMVDVNTIIGNPITTPDGTTIIPVSKVSFGFASGGSDLPTSNPKQTFGGGGGAGITLQPIAFLVVHEGNVRLLQIATSSNTADKVVNAVPDIIDKVSDVLSKNQKDKAKAPAPAAE
ncbi:MAG TPA: GerW family sporulation protein [Candidatus Merdivicinus faecavium]|nr:GerW family sporulation protein [Candidatus Merdivicinus faecavium]